MRIALLAAALAAAGAPAEFDPAWPAVLQGFVNDRGQVDFAGIRREPDLLKRQVEFVARTDPEVFKTREAWLAFHVNAYNALAMHHAAFSGIKPSSKVRFFFLSGHSIGGETYSLHAYENKVIRPAGEPRVHFALNCMVKDCPRLPREPFASARIEEQLDAAAREFCGSERRVRVDREKGAVRLSSILKWYKKDFLAKEPSLSAYVNRYRQDPVPLDFKIEFLPYDWTLNDSGTGE